VSDPTVELLAQRMGRVERQNRLCKLAAMAGVLVVAVMVWMGAATKSRTVEAESFIVRDDTGKTRATLAMLNRWNTTKTPGLLLYDEKGKEQASLLIGPEGPILVLGSDKVRLTLTRSVPAGPEIMMTGVDGKVFWSAP